MFAILVSIGSASELYLLRHQRGEGYQRVVADLVGGTLRVFGIPAEISDTIIHIEASTLEVSIECTGIQATAIFCAAVLAFPCSWRARGIGVIVGIAGVALLNLARISILALTAAYREDWFDSLHGLLMQGFLLLFVAPLWLVWMFAANKRANTGERGES